MRIFLEAEVLKWLLNLRVLPEKYESAEFRMNANGKYDINDEELIQSLEFGVLFADILKTLVDLNLGIFLNVKDNLDLLKETKS
jgi:hypothetical protein